MSIVAGQPQPFALASSGVACVSTATSSARQTTARSAPSRATSIVQEPTSPDACSRTVSPDAAESGQQ